MILFVHMLLGALTGQKVSSPVLAIVLAFLSHYFLDFIPHAEYGVENIKEKQWAKARTEIFKVLLDFTFGILFIFLFSKNFPIIYICAFFAISPDGLTVLNSILPNKILKMHKNIHSEKIHFLKYKKISMFWRVSTQAVVVIICIYILSFPT